MISTGTASGSVPWNTVQAVPFMPGLTSLTGMISVLPDFGRSGGVSAADAGSKETANPIRIAAVGIFMGSTTPVILIVLCASRRTADWDTACA